MTLAATIRYPPRPASCRREDSWASSVLLSCAVLSSARSWALAFCRAAILLAAEGPPVTQSKNDETGLVTSLVTRSTGPKMAAPTPRTGDEPLSRKSTVISATAAISRTPRTRRTRRVSCNATPRGRRSRGGPFASAPALGHENLAQRVEVLDALAGPEHHRVQRVVGHVDGHARLLADPLVEPAQQGPAAGQGDAPVHNVTGELGRALVQRRLHRVDDQVNRFLDGPPDLGGGNYDRLRQAADQVPAADLRV